MDRPVAYEIDSLESARSGYLDDRLANLHTYLHETDFRELNKRGTCSTVGAILDDPVTFLEIHKFREHIIRRRRIDL
jgi:hypothetical protein